MPKWFITPLQTVVSLFLFVEVSAVVGLALFPGVELWLWAEPQLSPGPLKVEHRKDRSPIGRGGREQSGR